MRFTPEDLKEMVAKFNLAINESTSEKEALH
jgi:hypothetical protein